MPIELFAPFTDSCVEVMKPLIESIPRGVSWQKTERQDLESFHYYVLGLFMSCLSLFMSHCMQRSGLHEARLVPSRSSASVARNLAAQCPLMQTVLATLLLRVVHGFVEE